MNLIQELKSIREELHISQCALSRFLGVSVNLIQKWETGKHCPSLANVELWARALGYELDLHKIEEKANAPI